MHPKRFPFGRAPFSEAAAAASEVRQGIILEGHVGAARAALIPSEIYVCRGGKVRERCEPTELDHVLPATRHDTVRSQRSGPRELILRDDSSYFGPPAAAGACSNGGSSDPAVSEVLVPTPVERMQRLRTENLNGPAARTHDGAQIFSVCSEITAADAGLAARSALDPRAAVPAPALTEAADIVPDAQQGDAAASTVAAVTRKFQMLRCRPAADKQSTGAPASPGEAGTVHPPSGPGGGSQMSPEGRHLRALKCAPLIRMMPPSSQDLAAAAPAASDTHYLAAAGLVAAPPRHSGPPRSPGLLSHAAPSAPLTTALYTRSAEPTELVHPRHEGPGAGFGEHTAAAVLLRPRSPCPDASVRAKTLLGLLPALPAPSEPPSALRSASRAGGLGSPPPAPMPYLQPPPCYRTAGTSGFSPTGPCASITNAAPADGGTAVPDTTDSSRPAPSCRDLAPQDVGGCLDTGPLSDHGYVGSFGRHVPHAVPHRALAGEEYTAFRHAQLPMRDPAETGLRCVLEALPAGPRSQLASRHRPQPTQLERGVGELEMQPSALPSAPLRCSSAYLLQPGSSAPLVSCAPEAAVVDTLYEHRGEQAARDPRAVRFQAVEAPLIHPQASDASQVALCRLQDAYGQLHALLAILQQHAEPTSHT
jgi:hypothetical protein